MKLGLRLVNQNPHSGIGAAFILSSRSFTGLEIVFFHWDLQLGLFNMGGVREASPEQN